MQRELRKRSAPNEVLFQSWTNKPWDYHKHVNTLKHPLAVQLNENQNVQNIF